MLTDTKKEGLFQEKRLCRSVELSDQSNIERIRARFGHNLSAHAFPSLYLWQKEMGLSLYMEDDFFAVKIDSRGSNSWFFPCGDEEKINRFIRGGMDTAHFSLCYLRPGDVQWLIRHFPDRWEVRREEESDEYICRISDYLAMEGSQYSEVRKKIRHLEREYGVKVQPISDATIDDAKSVLHQWREVAHHVSDGNVEDRIVSETALQKRNELNIFGSILYLDEKPVAMYAGFPIDAVTMDVVVGKCVPGAPNYTVYFAMREFLRQYQDRFLYCNLEEDLGIPGIRMVKRKMRPIAFNEIWEAELK